MVSDSMESQGQQQGFAADSFPSCFGLTGNAFDSAAGKQCLDRFARSIEPRAKRPDQAVHNRTQRK